MFPRHAERYIKKRQECKGDFISALRQCSSVKIAAIRRQSDRNIRKVRNTMLKKIRKKLLEVLTKKMKAQQPLTLLEKDFLRENGMDIENSSPVFSACALRR